MDNIDNNIKSQEISNENKSEKKEDLTKTNLIDIKNIENQDIPKENIKSSTIDIEKEKDTKPLLNQNSNSITINEKEKRQRRGKNETSDRIYKCPDCEKSYLSGPALVIHRKLKHNYNKTNENKSRGRPKKDYQQENSLTIAQNKYNNYFNNDMRKSFLSDEEKNNINNIIYLEQIKLNLEIIFIDYKSILFPNLENIENYNFYKYLKGEKNDINESFKDIYYLNEEKNLNNNLNYQKSNIPPLDYIFILYLKEIYIITNKEYYLFINKFIIFFREWINNKKKELIKEEYKTDEKYEFSQLFNSEGIPDYCNDFFIEYLEPNKFFGLNIEEFIELSQHFCFWLFLKKYTPNYLLPLKYKE